MSTPLPSNTPALPVGPVLNALNHEARRAMLAHLMDGQAHRSIELARVVRCSASMANKHLQTMMQAGVVTSQHQLYRLPPRFITGEPGVLDFGCCLVRLPVRAVAG